MTLVTFKKRASEYLSERNMEDPSLGARSFFILAIKGYQLIFMLTSICGFRP